MIPLSRTLCPSIIGRIRVLFDVLRLQGSTSHRGKSSLIVRFALPRLHFAHRLCLVRSSQGGTTEAHRVATSCLVPLVQCIALQLCEIGAREHSLRFEA